MNIEHLPQGFAKMFSQWNVYQGKRNACLRALRNVKADSKSNVASAKSDLDPRSCLFQPDVQAARWCRRLPLLLSCLATALFLVLVCSFLGVPTNLGTREEREKGREEGRRERRRGDVMGG